MLIETTMENFMNAFFAKQDGSNKISELTRLAEKKEAKKMLLVQQYLDEENKIQSKIEQN